MSTLQLIKQMAPFLDPHLLLHMLSKATNAKETGALQQSIKDKLLLSQKDKAKELEAAAKTEAKKLIDLLNNQAEHNKLREEHRFTLENLKREFSITIQDVQATQKYAKILYESGRYKDAEKVLFSLKEILVNESQSNSDLILQVFWGLLACEILNGKGRDVVENTTVKKMRDLIEKRFNEGAITDSQFTQYMCWLLHWLLMYCFTSKDVSNTALFATILSDFNVHGQSFLIVVQMNSSILMRYMISSFLLAKSQQNIKHKVGQDIFEKIALPVVLDSIQGGSKDVFALFLKAIFEDFDIEKAIQMVDEIKKVVDDDFLLKNFSAEIVKQAYLVAFKVKCKLFRTIDEKEFQKYLKDDNASTELKNFLLEDGFEAEVDKGKNTISCKPARSMDAEIQIKNRAVELLQKTAALNEQYQNQALKIKEISK